MDPRLMQEGRALGASQDPRYTQNFQQHEHEASRDCDARPNSHSLPAKEHQHDDDFVGVDLSSYSGAAIDYVQRVPSKEVDVYQDPYNRHFQMKPFNLFHRASGQLKKHFIEQDSATHGLRRRNAVRHPPSIRNTWPQWKHEHSDEVRDISHHGLVEGRSMFNRLESADSEFSFRGHQPPSSSSNAQATEADIVARSGAQSQLTSSASETNTLPRVLSPVFEEGDDAVLSISRPPSLRAESVSSVNSAFVSSTQVVQRSSPKLAAYIDFESSKSVIPMDPNRGKGPTHINIVAALVDNDGDDAPSSLEELEDQIVSQCPERVYHPSRSTGTSKAPNRTAKTDTCIEKDAMSTANMVTRRSHHEDDSLGCEGKASQLLIPNHPTSSPTCQLGNLPGFIPCLPLDIDHPDRPVDSSPPLPPVPHRADSSSASSQQLPYNAPMRQAHPLPPLPQDVESTDSRSFQPSLTPESSPQSALLPMTMPGSKESATGSQIPQRRPAVRRTTHIPRPGRREFARP